MTTCSGCGSKLEQSATGRPKVYCGPVCRRAAEYALRRVQSLLMRAEQKAQDAAARAVSGVEPWQRKSGEQAVEFWRGEVARLRSELRVLLTSSTADHEGTA